MDTITQDGQHPARRVRRAPGLVLLCNAGEPTGEKFALSLDDVRSLEIGRGPEPQLTLCGGQPGRWRLTLADAHVSETHAVLARTKGGWRVQDLGSKNGTFVRGARVSAHFIEEGDSIELGQSFLLFTMESVAADSPTPRLVPPYRGPAYGMETFLSGLRDQYERLVAVAASDVRVLVHGETGTGKELVARAYHELTGRSGPFVAINCGAIPTSLIEAELFGHRKGAFSGAISDRLGVIREAQGGTLFLDEIADLPLLAQAKLLRVLQERKVRPVGDSREYASDVRICCASHGDLPLLVSRKQFRADLYGRLAGLRFELPTLRERVPDAGILVGRLLERLGETQRSLHRTAVQLVSSHDWKLNVRELEHALALACATEQGPLTLDAYVRDNLARAKAPTVVTPPVVELAVDEDQRRHQLAELLERHEGNISEISRQTGRARALIRRWLDRYGLDAASYRAVP